MVAEKSKIYEGRRQIFVEWKGQNQPEIALNDASIVIERTSLSRIREVLMWHGLLTVTFHSAIGAVEGSQPIHP
jgi:hypothetical protein